MNLEKNNSSVPKLSKEESNAIFSDTNVSIPYNRVLSCHPMSIFSGSYLFNKIQPFKRDEPKDIDVFCVCDDMSIALVDEYFLEKLKPIAKKVFDGQYEIVYDQRYKSALANGRMQGVDLPVQIIMSSKSNLDFDLACTNIFMLPNKSVQGYGLTQNVSQFTSYAVSGSRKSISRLIQYGLRGYDVSLDNLKDLAINAPSLPELLLYKKGLEQRPYAYAAIGLVLAYLRSNFSDEAPPKGHIFDIITTGPKNGYLLDSLTRGLTPSDLVNSMVEWDEIRSDMNFRKTDKYNCPLTSRWIDAIL